MGAVNAAKSALHIGSPSKLFKQYGVWTMEGLGAFILAFTFFMLLVISGIAKLLLNASVIELAMLLQILQVT
jgi:hypothetical protein